MKKVGNSSKQRPAVLRALGHNDLPSPIEADGESFQLVKLIKHDSWAATGLYERISPVSGPDTEPSRKIICKFNRRQPILFLPMSWLGRFLGRRERNMYRRLADIELIPNGCGLVSVQGQVQLNVAAHDYVEGHPLRWHDVVDKEFFPRLRAVVEELHRRNIAYVDLHKSENVIVDDQGRPQLIDFQVSVKLPRVFPCGVILRQLQKADLYHLAKMARRSRPDLFDLDDGEQLDRLRPVWIKLHRLVGAPLRNLRRRLLVRAGVRRGKGRAHTEDFIEEGLRIENRQEKPVLHLHALLSSRRYFEACQHDQMTFIENVRVDLGLRTPEENRNKTSEQRARDERYLRSDRPGVARGILRSTRLVRLSRNWSERWYHQSRRRITKRIKQASEEPRVPKRKAS